MTSCICQQHRRVDRQVRRPYTRHQRVVRPRRPHHPSHLVPTKLGRQTQSEAAGALGHRVVRRLHGQLDAVQRVFSQRRFLLESLRRPTVAVHYIARPQQQRSQPRHLLQPQPKLPQQRATNVALQDAAFRESARDVGLRWRNVLGCLVVIVCGPYYICVICTVYFHFLNTEKFIRI